MAPTVKYRTNELPDPIQTLAKALSESLSPRAKVAVGELATALHRAIEGPESRPVRMLLLSHLAAQEAREEVWAGQAEALEKMLTTEEAAELLGCSRPHVAMLIDGGKLPGSTRTEGGHRRVPESAVRALKAERDPAQGKPDADYVAAGVAAGIYELPESAWVGTGKAKRGK